MPCCTKSSDYWRQLLAFSVLALFACSVCAAGISIKKAEARLVGENYLLAADFDIHLPSAVEDALHHSVTLYFVGELSLHRSRWYWPDTQIVLHQQTSKLAFNSLTRQYRIGSGGLYQSFATLDEALRVLGHLSSPPIEASLLGKGSGGYFSRLARKGSKIDAIASLRIDVSQLPKPLQINALTSEQWNVESGQFHWEIGAEEPAEESKP